MNIYRRIKYCLYFLAILTCFLIPQTAGAFSSSATLNVTFPHNYPSVYTQQVTIDSGSTKAKIDTAIDGIKTVNVDPGKTYRLTIGILCGEGDYLETRLQQLSGSTWQTVGGWTDWSIHAGSYTITCQYIQIPGSPTFSNVAQTGLTVNWDTRDPITGTIFELYRDGNLIYSGTGSSFSDTGLTPGVTYSYKVRAKDPWGSYTNYSSTTSVSAVPSTPGIPTVTTTSSTGYNISWTGVTGATAYEVWRDGSYLKNVAGTSTTDSGLGVNTQHTYQIKSLNASGKSPLGAGTTKFTLANPPTAAAYSGFSQTGLTGNINANGNPGSTQYQFQLKNAGGSVIQGPTAWGTATSYNFSGLSSGINYSVEAKSRNGNNIETSWVNLGNTITIPGNPTLTGSHGGLSWSNSAGRGYVTGSWSAVQGASGYKLRVFDGYEYRVFDLGNVTSFDTRVLKIYPAESTLDGYSNNTVTSDLFNHVQGGNDLRDTPIKLYQKTSGTAYDSNNNYWLRLTAYNSSGESDTMASSALYQPTLPNRSDMSLPIINSVTINNGDVKTGSLTVNVTVTASDSAVSNYTSDTSDDASGIVSIQFSNDNSVWSSWQSFDTTVTSPGELRTKSFTWEVAAGGGTKTAYVRVKDQAGNISAVQSDTILFVDDTTAPSASFAINGGDTSTSSKVVTLTITATDDLTSTNALQVRFSNDGITFSNYEAYAATKNWDLAWPNTATSDGEKVVYMQVKDGQGNTVTVSSKIGLNTTPPSGTVTSSTGTSSTISLAGENITTRFVNVGRVSLDLSPSNGDRIQVSMDGVNWSPWEKVPTDNKKLLALTGADGQRTIFIKYGNSYGGESVVIPIEFTLDTTAPTVEASWADGRSMAASGTSVPIVIKAYDNITPQASLEVSTDGGSSWSSYSRSKNLTVSGSGYRSFPVLVRDLAGNIGEATLKIFIN